MSFTPDPNAALLFTAFEPSGDDHAAGVIAELKRRNPDRPIFAWGGPRMERAGATIIRRTGDDAVMGMPGLAKIREHQKINADVDRWLATNPVAVHVPVDSPAANFPLCEIAKKHKLKVVHLVAPQIWAWGRWRIHKLRRRTDMVLCLLPFEQRFFERRDVPAKFIGHVLFDKAVDKSELARRAQSFGDGTPKIAMMPGSRPDELHRHFPVLLEAFAAIRRVHPAARGVVAATNPGVADLLKDLARLEGGWPDGLAIANQETDAIINWCDIALVKSGTVTLQVTKQLKPMVVFYKKANPLFFLLARAILSTRLFSLPNVIASKRIVPEFIPHWGGGAPIAEEALQILASPERQAEQIASLKNIVAQFQGLHAARLAADAIEQVAARPPSAV